MPRRLPKAALFGALTVLLLFTQASAQDEQASAQDERGVFTTIGPVEVLGDGPTYLEVGLGVFDAFDNESADSDTSGAAQFELRWGQRLFFIGPALGLVANADGGVFGYGGIYADLALERFIITPVLSLGGYSEGEGIDLGGTFQFRSALGISYEFDDGSRIGVRAAHISNAGIHEENPGEEEFFVTYALPF